MTLYGGAGADARLVLSAAFSHRMDIEAAPAAYRTAIRAAVRLAYAVGLEGEFEREREASLEDSREGR